MILKNKIGTDLSQISVGYKNPTKHTHEQWDFQKKM